MAGYAKSTSAADLFALSQGTCNMGDQECHWCASPCTREFLHDDPPPLPFVRSKSTARRPGNPYVCTGCWLWLRKSVTVRFLGSGFLDRQAAKNHSWYITEEGAWALRAPSASGLIGEDTTSLYGALLKPPRKFVLALRNPSGGVDVLPQLLLTNDTPASDAVMYDSAMKMTLNNVPYEYTVYELEEAVRAGTHEGYGPGVRALFTTMGPPPEGLRRALTPPEKRVEKRERGRPPALEDSKYTAKRPLVASGLRA